MLALFLRGPSIDGSAFWFVMGISIQAYFTTRQVAQNSGHHESGWAFLRLQFSPVGAHEWFSGSDGEAAYRRLLPLFALIW